MLDAWRHQTEAPGVKTNDDILLVQSDLVGNIVCNHSKCQRNVKSLRQIDLKTCHQVLERLLQMVEAEVLKLKVLNDLFGVVHQLNSGLECCFEGLFYVLDKACRVNDSGLVRAYHHTFII